MVVPKSVVVKKFKFCFFFSSRRRHTRSLRDWSSDVCSSDLVEDRGDGLGQFLWPRQQGHDGKWFGFDQKILSKKRAQYEKLGQIIQFRAQYYNDPNSTEGSGINREFFQYYEPKKLTRQSGRWFIGN